MPGRRLVTSLDLQTPQPGAISDPLFHSGPSQYGIQSSLPFIPLLPHLSFEDPVPASEVQPTRHSPAVPAWVAVSEICKGKSSAPQAMSWARIPEQMPSIRGGDTPRGSC